MMPIAKPAASPPVKGIPKFPAIVEIWLVSVSELLRVVSNDWDTIWSLSQSTLIIPCDWRYIIAPKNIPTTTAKIFITFFIANPMRNPTTPPEPIENKVGERTSSKTCNIIILKRIAFLKEFLGIIATNPSTTIEELDRLVDHKLETEERALKNAKNIFDTEKIFVNVRILGWIKYLIMQKNGRVPREEVQEED
jgi:hypothetical protein